ncbi:MAG: hypothetical protein RR595_15255 [Lysinibacillus sp.]
MATFTLTYPKLFDRLSNIPILNEQNEAVCVLQKVERSAIGKALNMTFLVVSQDALPQRFETRTMTGEPLFQVQSTFLTKGSSYQLVMQDGTAIPIKRKTVQLIEFYYTFTMDNFEFRFEKDFTSTAYLYCNDKKIACASTSGDGLIHEGIIYTLFESDDTLFVALLATLYQSLFAIGN